MIDEFAGATFDPETFRDFLKAGAESARDEARVADASR